MNGKILDNGKYICNFYRELWSKQTVLLNTWGYFMESSKIVIIRGLILDFSMNVCSQVGLLAVTLLNFCLWLLLVSFLNNEGEFKTFIQNAKRIAYILRSS